MEKTEKGRDTEEDNKRKRRGKQREAERQRMNE